MKLILSAIFASSLLAPFAIAGGVSAGVEKQTTTACDCEKGKDKGDKKEGTVACKDGKCEGKEKEKQEGTVAGCDKCDKKDKEKKEEGTIAGCDKCKDGDKDKTEKKEGTVA
ncbi:MAG: hypothetical protein QM680_06980 [Luteolibacter sp.]